MKNYVSLIAFINLEKEWVSKDDSSESVQKVRKSKWLELLCQFQLISGGSLGHCDADFEDPF